MVNRQRCFVPALPLEPFEEIDFVEEDRELLVEWFHRVRKSRPAKKKKGSHWLGCVLALRVVKGAQAVSVPIRELEEISEDALYRRESSNRMLSLAICSLEANGETSIRFAFASQGFDGVSEEIWGDSSVRIQCQNVFTRAGGDADVIASCIAVIDRFHQGFEFGELGSS